MIIKIKNIGYCQYLKFDRNNDNENYFRLETVFDHNKIFRKIIYLKFEFLYLFVNKILANFMHFLKNCK